MPAQLTSMSTPPSAVSASPKPRSSCCMSPRSARTACAPSSSAALNTRSEELIMASFAPASPSACAMP